MKLAPSDHPDIDGMIDAIRSQNLREVAGRFGNVLELVTGERYPAISRIEQVMRDYGALGAMMSGSGPTVFGLLPIQGQPRQPMRICGSARHRSWQNKCI